MRHVSPIQHSLMAEQLFAQRAVVPEGTAQQHVSKKTMHWLSDREADREHATATAW